MIDDNQDGNITIAEDINQEFQVAYFEDAVEFDDKLINLSCH